MSYTGQKYVKNKEDIEQIRELAKKLNDEWSPKRRMDLQQDFVRKMGAKYGQENATLMLTKAWKLADKLRTREQYV